MMGECITSNELCKISADHANKELTKLLADSLGLFR